MGTEGTMGQSLPDKLRRTGAVHSRSAKRMPHAGSIPARRA